MTDSDSSSPDSLSRQNRRVRKKPRRRLKSDLHQDLSEESGDRDLSSDESFHNNANQGDRDRSGCQTDHASNDSESDSGREDASDQDHGNDAVLDDNAGIIPTNHGSGSSSDVPNDQGAEIPEELMAAHPNSEQSSGSDTEPEQGNVSETSSDHDSEDNEVEHINEDELPLYHGAPLTVRESLLTVLSLGMKHGLTGKCLNDILNLISIHCPPDNRCIKTLHKFKKYFSMIGQSSLKSHYFCTGCVYPVESKDTVCGNCQGENDNSFFIELPLKSQLQTMLLRLEFYHDLQYRFQRRKKNENNIEDIYDGIMYKNQVDAEFLSNPNNISFSWYTDGLSIFKSSKFSIWPLYFVINELSYTKRTQKENIILAGLWFGSHKPNPNVFLQPFHSCLSEFRNHGFEMNVAGNAPILLKGMLLCGVADLPAKSLMMRFKQYNGAFGCANCVSEGSRYDLGNATIQVYPYSPIIHPRRNEDIPQFARQAVDLQGRDPNAAVFGVKGPSLLFYMVPDMIRSTAIDKMHGVDYGVFKLILSLMFDSCHSNEPFSASAVLGLVDQRLSKIKPPSFVERMPRTIKNHIALWKSAEYKLMLMVYSIPVFLDIIDDEYLKHHCLLVSAVFLLNQESISNDHLNAASDLLHNYVSKFEQLYGLRYLSMNVHQLLHLPQIVKDNGPLWIYACYFYEDLNGRLAKLIHGTRHAGMQVCSAASAYLNLPVMIRSLPEASAARKFCENLNSKIKNVKIADEISVGMYAVGTYSYPSDFTDNMTRHELQGLGIQSGRRKYFHRLRKNGVMFYSSMYQRTVQKESSYVQVLHNNVPELGRIKYFVKSSSCKPQCNVVCVESEVMYFAAIELYERQPWFIHAIPSIRLPYMNKVTPTNRVVVCPTSSLQCLCFYMNIADSEYIFTPVNKLEAD